MDYIFDNLAAILAAAAAAWLFGAVWYGLLGTRWMKAASLQESDIRRPDGSTSKLPFILAFIFEAWMAAVLAGALILAPVEAGGWTVALGTAFILWVGFVLPTQLINHRYTMRPWALTAIDTGHWLGVLLLQAAVLTLIGVSLAP
ncbi:hypothetical protein B5C34_03020 [Pacificimonas flava]|uniref:DUF1761 domain-containing protein n=2 Tax=Pacificimonas TaxID=1960290 RepID=A0A219B2X0_9SPHN|nr:MULTISPECIES: DUF1761 domain-containing protein [Pacificimonas]MBZ6377808.1 DUF1761 domain-containing protein [Pacificimonas aurantium]OWV32524.1 hypothetical protein B5C34_03020 [Pacificimonas flava]